MRNCLLTLAVAMTGFTLGCSDSKPEPKPPAGTDLKPLAAPKSPGDAPGNQKAAKAPGGGANTQ
jgi:hypothetical protein